MEKTWYAKSTRSTRLHVFVEAMERFARQQGLLVRTYTPRMVKKRMIRLKARIVLPPKVVIMLW